MADRIKVLVLGCGKMGLSHARAYAKIPEFELLGFVSRHPDKRPWIKEEFPGIPHYSDFDKAFEETKPDAVSISTYPDTHAKYAIQSMELGAHVFLEKPISQTVEEAEAILKVAQKTKRKVLVGYILHYHPSWKKFVEIAQGLGKPLVMRLNLNQQSSGEQWEVHKNLLGSLSPIVDCGVHYVDIMCQMTGETPTQVNAIGARLSDEVAPDMYNYGQLQVQFDGGSIGWYEAGWGPMISEEAFFIKDIMGPKGSASITKKKTGTASSDIDSHTKTDGILIHHSELDSEGNFQKKDEYLDMSGEPDHQGLCDLQQLHFLKVIQEDIDLNSHIQNAINSLKIVLAADESIKTKQQIKL